MDTEGNTVTYHKPQAGGEGNSWVDQWREPKGSRAVILGFVILASIATVDALVYATGGTVYVWAHLMYLPLILAAAGFRIYGGVAAALIAGLTLGPFMPLNVAAALPQTPSNWVFRLCFFMLVGAFSGLLSKILNQQISQIKRREEHIQYIINNTKEAIFQIDLQGNYIYGNDAAEQLTGYPLPQLLQMNVMQLTALEYQPLIKERLQRRVASGDDEKEFEIEIQHKDGHRIWTELTSRKVYDREHKLIGIQGVARDITERRNMERNIRQLSRIYAVSSGINELIVREKNPQALFEGACRITVEKGKFSLAWIGLLKDPSQPIQMAAHAGATPDTLAALQQVFTNPALGCVFTQRALETGEHAVCNDVAHAPESAPWRQLALERGYLSLVSLPLNVRGQRAGVMNIYAREAGFFDAGELRLLDELAADISFALDLNQREIERRQLEEQFRQVQKMEGIGQLAGGVAHDFNNILAIMLLQTDLLKSTCNISPEQAEFANEISAATQRAAALTRQLLMFSRKQTMHQQELDLNESINHMAKMLRRILGGNIQMRFKFAVEKLFVCADAGMMDQVLMNLVVNSRDAMTDGGQLVIETSAVEFDQLAAAQSAKIRPGSFVCLSINDTGRGIPPEYLPRIFEPFFTTKDVGKGTGLGLATVFGIVQQHHGWVDVYSEVGAERPFASIFRAWRKRPNRNRNSLQWRTYAAAAKPSCSSRMTRASALPVAKP